MKIEHVHNFRIAGFDLNFTIMSVRLNLCYFLNRIVEPWYIIENEMHSRFNSLWQSVVMSFNSLTAFDRHLNSD